MVYLSLQNILKIKNIGKYYKKENMNIPIIILSAKDEEFDEILGLELGADDYITKPFSVREVLARVKVIFRRTSLIFYYSK